VDVRLLSAPRPVPEWGIVMAPRYTVCRRRWCPNFGKLALHPRSETPGVCGVCGEPVEFLRSEAYYLERGRAPPEKEAGGGG